jgi:chemotaxis signal transduction protein
MTSEQPAIHPSRSQFHPAQNGDQEFGTSEHLVSFILGGETFHIPASRISEITHPLQVTPVPNMPAEIRGISAHRGEIIAVLESGSATNDPGYESQAFRPKWIMLTAEPGSTHYALPVDRLNEIVRRPDDPRVSGQYQLQGQSPELTRQEADIRLFDVDAVLERIESSLS